MIPTGMARSGGVEPQAPHPGRTLHPVTTPTPDPELWRITVEVPMSVGDTARDSLFTAVADAVFEWTPEDRDGWDPDVSAGPTPTPTLTPTPRPTPPPP